MKIHHITLLLITLLILTSCATTTRPTAQDDLIFPSGFFFTQYTEQGFLFTPEGYPGEYESKGIIYINYQPRFLYLENPNVPRIPGYYIYKEPGLNHWWRVSFPDPAALIEQAYKLAIEMGADAVINFEMEPTTYTNGTLTVANARLTGFAIKRTNP